MIPVSGHQVPVRLRENSVPWVGEKHGAVDDPVRPAESVDGSKNVMGMGELRV